MERENQRKYPIFDQLSTEELEKLLVQDFAATDEEPDVDYIMAIMEVITERKKAAGCQADVDAAWKDFQENYQGQAAAFEHTIHREAESSDHHQTPPAQIARKKTRVFRYALVAAIIIVLLGGTASGFGRVFQAVVNWGAETFGFESPYAAESPENDILLEDPYEELRVTVAEYTDLPVIPKWAPAEITVDPDFGVQRTVRTNSIHLTGVYDTDDGEFVVRIMIHNEALPKYTGAYQWNEDQIITSHFVNGLKHDLVYNYDNNVAAWTNENVECVIQGNLSMDELEKMIDSIYEE